MRVGRITGWMAGCLVVAMAGIVVAAEIRSQQKDVVAGTRDSFNWNPLCKDSPYEMVLNVDNTDTKDFKVPSASGTGDGGANWTLTLEDTRNADFQKPIPSAEPKEDGKPYKPRFKGAFEGNGGGVRNGRGGGAPTWNLEGEYDILRVEIENTAPRDTDDIQVQYFTNNAGVFTYTAIPLKVYYRLVPDSGWTPDSVEMHIKNPAGSTVRTIALPASVGQQQTTWDGKDSAGNYVANGSNYVVEITAITGATACTATNGLTVYEIRQGNCVYRPIAVNEHAAILYEYLGGNRVADLRNNNNYRVMEHPGTGGTTGPSIYGNFNNWIGAFCPQGVTRQQRKAILEKAHELDAANIPYVSFPYLDALTHNNAALSPAGANWAGTVGDILRIRCDGTVEVAYEDTGVRLYGGDAWWNIMTPGSGNGSNLALHNDGGNSITPHRQREGTDAAHNFTQNRVDAIHLP